MTVTQQGGEATQGASGPAGPVFSLEVVDGIHCANDSVCGEEKDLPHRNVSVFVSFVFFFIIELGLLCLNS